MTTTIYAFSDKRQVDLILSLGKNNLLISYYYLNQKKPGELLEHIYSQTQGDGIFMLDSGAYSAWKSGFEINIWEYIEFIKVNHKYFTHIVCLDVIDNPIYSEINHRIMLEELKDFGLTIIPVFHSGEPFSVLDYMVEKHYKYIGISPNNDWMEDRKRKWLKKVYSRYDFDNLGIKTHGFGYQSTDGLLMFPMTTADAITWKIAAGYGRIICPVNPRVRYSDQAIGDPDHINSIPGGHSQFTLDVCAFLNIDPELLRTDHTARSLYNIEAIDRLLQMPKTDIILDNYNLFVDDHSGYLLEWDIDKLEEQYEEVLSLGQLYTGVPHEAESVKKSAKPSRKKRLGRKEPPEEDKFASFSAFDFEGMG